jgi:hypothetical protein
LQPKHAAHPPSQTWQTFLANHVWDLVSLDFFTVPTACLRVFLLDGPAIVDAFPDDAAPAYLLRDRDTVYGDAFRPRVKGMGIRKVLTAPSRPWQNPFAERLIASICREDLDSGPRVERTPHPSRTRAARL